MSVTLNPDANGSIVGTIEVNYGDKPTYTVEPYAGFHITDVRVNGVSVGPVSIYTFTTGITSPVTIAANFTADIMDNLIAYYPFNGNAEDGSGNGNHGLVQEAVLSVDRFGRSNNAYGFNGLNSSIQISGLPASFPGDFTVSYWVKSSEPYRMHALSFGDTTSDNFDFDFNDNPYRLSAYWNGSGEIMIGTNSVLVTDGIWHHILTRRTGSHMELYIDGALKGEAAYLGKIAPGRTLHIGRGSYSAFWWNGLIDDIRLYNCAVTDSDLISLSNDKPPLSPNGGEVLLAGSVYDITWIADSDVAAVRLEYSIDNGITWSEIVSSTPAATGRYSWTVPDTVSTLCRVRIQDVSNGNILYLSNSFSITISAPKWRLVTDHAKFSPRDGVGILNFKGKIWLLGGWEGVDKNTNNEIWSSDDGINWKFVRNAPWPARHSAGNIVYDNKMWVISGDANADVWFSPDGVDWTLATDSPPWGRRYKPYVIVYDNKIWLMGGLYLNGSGSYVPYNDVWNSTDGINWIKVTEHAAWAPRAIIHGSVVFDGKMWILGGGVYGNPETYYNDIWNSSNGIDWNLVSSNPPWLPRLHQSIIVYADKIWVLSGHDQNGKKNDVWTSPDGKNWDELPGTPWSKRHATSVVVYNDFLWLVAGYLVNDIWKLHLSGNLIINNGIEYSDSRTVTLTVSAPETSVQQMQFSNDGVFWSEPESYTKQKTWTLSDGDGDKTVYVRFKNDAGSWSSNFNDTIFLSSIPFLNILSPTESDRLTAETNFDITWFADSRVTNIKLEYSIDDGATWSDIVTAVSATAGRYSWAIPNVLSGFCLIRASDTAGGTVLYTSANPFFIYNNSEGLIGYYPFNGNAEDASGNGNHGLVQEAVLSVDRFGRSNNAYGFNGLNSSIEISGLPVSFPGDFTVSYWVKSSEPYRIHALSFGETTNENFDFDFNDGPYGLSAYWNGLGENLLAASSVPVTDGIWHHILTRRTGSHMELYIDGALKGEAEYQGEIAPGRTLHIGRGSYSAFWWNGLIDDIRLYNRAVTDADLKSLSNDKPALSPNGGEGLLAGSVYDITWIADSNVTAVRLEYSIDDGTTWSEIVSSTPVATGHYSWTVPDTVSTRCRVRKSNEADGDVIYMSANTFSIFKSTDGLIASYPFDGSADDQSGNGNHGLVQDALLSLDRFGRSNSAFSFNGLDSSIEIAVPTSLPGDFTISYWVRSSQSYRMHALSFGETARDNFDFDFNDDPYGLWVYWNSFGENMIGAPKSVLVTDGIWHHILARRSGSHIELHVDGVLKGSAEYQGEIAPTRSLHIGRGSYDAFWWKGSIDDLQIYNKALSDANITSLSNDKIRLLSPNGGENVHAGSVYDITWIADSSVTVVKLEFSTDDGTTWNEIVSSIPAAIKRYSWTVPNTLSTRCRIRISNEKDGPVAYISASTFSILTDGLIAYYPFDGNADDESGNGNHGLVQNAVLSIDRFGRPNSAYTFNGLSSSIEISNLPVSFLGDFTIAYWMKSSESYRMHALSFGQTPGGNFDFDFNDDPYGVWVYWNSSGENQVGTPKSVSVADGAWHHILVRRSGFRIELYLDGTLKKATEYQGEIAPTRTLHIGRGSYDAFWWKGAIDDVRLYNGAVSDTDIAHLSNDRPLAADGLIAYYPFDGNAEDESGNGNHGLVQNALLSVDRFGHSDKAYTFNGLNSSIEISNLPVSFLGDFTIAYWMKSSESYRMHALSFGQTPGDNFDFDFNDDPYGVWVYWNGSGENLIGAPNSVSITDGAWHHILVRRYGFRMELYIDGTLTAVTEYQGDIAPTRTLHIGRGSYGPFWWNGAIDDVRLYNRAVSDTDIAPLSNDRPLAADGLIAYYPFDGNADDGSGNGNHGLVQNAVLSIDRFGRPNNAYTFNGLNSSIEISNLPVSFLGDFTIAYWMKSSESYRMHALSFGQTPGDNFDFDFNDDPYGVWVYWNGSGENLIGAPNSVSITDGAWHHILVRRYGFRMELYIDGTLTAVTEYQGEAPGRTLHIGRGSYGPFWWNGPIDDVRLYNRALTYPEIKFISND